MAYNNGFPVGYQYIQPMQPQYQQMPYQQGQQFQQVPQQFPQSFPQQSNGFPQQIPQQNPSMASTAIRADWVQGQAGANAYNLLKPGEKAFLFDSDSSCFYVKIIDADGKPQPLKVFDYQERGTTVVQPAVVPQIVSQPEPQPQIDLSPYITREEVTQMINAEVERRISEMNIPAPVTPAKSKKEK